MPLLEKSELFFLAAAGVVRESWMGNSSLRWQKEMCLALCSGSGRSSSRSSVPCVVKASGMQGRVGVQRMLCLAGGALQRAGANMPGIVLVFTSEFGFLLS